MTVAVRTAVRASEDGPEIGLTRAGEEEPWPGVEYIYALPSGELRAEEISTA